MKERPILFSAQMVRAILSGTKTQTRRALRVQPLDVIPCKGDKAGIEWVGRMEADPPRGVIFSCKFGRPGDRLWVRESWRVMGNSPEDTLDMFDINDLQYRADDDQSYIEKYRSPIFMPRRFSRILLEIVSVRVERLQDISEADAISEGITTIWPDGPRQDKGPNHYTIMIDRVSYNAPTASGVYAMLWEQINGAGSWDANPWVWVIEFRRI